MFESLQSTLKIENLPSTIEILKKTNINLKSTIYNISKPKHSAPLKEGTHGQWNSVSRQGPPNSQGKS